MLDAIATVILAGMMLMPIINLVVGIIAGTCLFGVAGGFAGAALAVLITIAPFQLWRGQTGCTTAARGSDGKPHFSPGPEQDFRPNTPPDRGH